MSILHIAFYPSDWLAGTRGLTDAETGVYITLIARMYEMAGPIERDDNRLARLCGSKSRASFVKALEYLISEGKITEVGGGLFNERVEKEIKNSTEKSSKAKAAAQSRWDKKANKNNGGSDANASPKHMPQRCQLEPELYIEKEDTNVSSKKKRGTRLPDDWFLPADWGTWALSEGWSETTIRAESEKYKDYWHSVSGQKGVKLNWFAVWRNWMRNSNQPKVINGGQNVSTPSKSTDRVNAFIAGARGAS